LRLSVIARSHEVDLVDTWRTDSQSPSVARSRNYPMLQKSAILVVGLALRPLEADSDYSFSHWTLVGV
jgi:hypothetical protein